MCVILIVANHDRNNNRPIITIGLFCILLGFSRFQIICEADILIMHYILMPFSRRSSKSAIGTGFA